MLSLPGSTDSSLIIQDMHLLSISISSTGLQVKLPFRHTGEKNVEGLLLNTPQCYIRSFLYFLLVAFCRFFAI